MYDNNFYDIINEGSRTSAEVVVPLVLELFPKVKSVLDVGCGQGVWTKVFKDNGCKVRGIDGDYIDLDSLCIDKSEFVAHDLSQGGGIHGNYDLAVSLEVAEHLPESSADDFVESLCSAADLILFSAAVPGQGGVGHINEQWPEYWAEKFAKRGYAMSGKLRWSIWQNDLVENWYRNNLMLCTNDKEIAKTDLFAGPESRPFGVINPTLWNYRREIGF